MHQQSDGTRLPNYAPPPTEVVAARDSVTASQSKELMPLAAETARFTRSRWFWGRKRYLLVDARGVFVMREEDVVTAISLEEIRSEPTVERGLLWSRVGIRTSSGSITFRGMSAGTAQEACNAIQFLWRQHVLAQAEEVRQLLEQWDAMADSRRWMRHSWAEEWSQRAREAPPLTTSDGARRILREAGIQGLERLSVLLADVDAARAEVNSGKEQRELDHAKSLFDTVEKNPLTISQRLACIRDEDANLVLASAGSGKTSVIVARSQYLVSVGLAHPSEILVLAFNTEAARELSERITAQLGPASGINVATFHSFAFRAAVTGQVKPAVSPLAQDDGSLEEWIVRWLQDGLHRRDPAVESSLRNLLIQDTGDDSVDLNSSVASGVPLIDAVRRAALADDARATFDYQRVKSHQELVIANFLYLHGVDYDYERKYPHPNATFEYGPYKPDFYLPEYDIYLEHFAVTRPDEDGPPFIDKTAYLNGVQWKRGIHREHGTTLIETSSADSRQQGGLTGQLAERLQQAGLTLTPRPLHPLFDNLTMQDRLDPRVVLISLLARFLTAAKASLKTRQELQQAAREAGARYEAFVTLESLLSASYEAELSAKGDIDYTDMLVKGAAAIRSHRTPNPYRFVMVDELQDMSAARVDVLHALRETADDISLLGVGDDWQSINAFTGSDVSYVSQFESTFGHHCATTLDRTFRFSQATATMSSGFISKNPLQTLKAVTASFPGDRSSTTVAFSGGKQDPSHLVTQLIDFDDIDMAGREVLVLSRYRQSHNDRNMMSALKRRFPEAHWTFSTIHRAKGKEADYVFALGLTSSGKGFPTRMTDDPVLSLVLPESEQFPDAEERRLLYVAMTRGRIRSWLIGRSDTPSRFLQELCDDNSGKLRAITATSDGLVEQRPMNPSCPVCQEGFVVQRNGRYGAFFACSNFPRCNQNFRTCSHCDDGPLLRIGEDFRCGNEACDQRTDACPKCSSMNAPRWTGALVQRQGPYGAFWACRNWRPDRSACNYTQKMARSRS
jgi:DNA helicase-4